MSRNMEGEIQVSQATPGKIDNGSKLKILVQQRSSNHERGYCNPGIGKGEGVASLDGSSTLEQRFRRLHLKQREGFELLINQPA